MEMSERRLILVLVDAVSYTYLESMPFLLHLASRGTAYSVRPAPGFRGVEPILNGAWTSADEVPFHFCEGEGKHVPAAWLAPGDRLLPSGVNRVARKMLSLSLGKEDPQLVPSWLLNRLERSTGTRRTPRLISDWEASGRRVWWFTRDSKVEQYKKWSSKVFYFFLGRKLLREVQSACTADVVYFEFSTALDAVGHRFGPADGKTLRSARRIDHDLGEFLNRLGIHNGSTDVAVLSDHGMSLVEHEVDVERLLGSVGLRNGEDYHGLWNSNFGQIWASADAIQRILAAIEGISEVRAVGAEDHRFWFGQDRAYGDLILACREGAVIRPNHFQGARTVKGMHGYLDSRTPESRALCIVFGEGFVSPPSRTEIEMPDLFGVLSKWGGR